MGGKKEKMWLCLPFCYWNYRIKCYVPASSKQLQTVAMKSSGVHTNPKKDAATNPPIQGRKNTVICVQE